MDIYHSACERILSKEFFASLVTLEVISLISFLILVQLIKKNKVFLLLISLLFIATLLIPLGAAIFKGQDLMEKICDIII